jgi:hypothetical protein
VLGSPRVTRASEPTCSSAHLDGQKAKAEGRLRSARELFLACGREGCPGMLRADCAEWLAQVERDLPTVVVAARDGEGRDLVEAELTIDSVLVSMRLDGKAVPLDPGTHQIKVERKGMPVAVVEVVARVGEKNRQIVVTLGEARASRRLPAATWVLGAMGAAALASFGVFGVLGEAQYRHLSSTCAPSCDTEDARAVRTKFAIADISLGVSLASLGGALVVWLAQGRAPADRPAAALEVRAVPGGAFLSLGTSF